MDDFDVQGKERELDELLSEVKSLLEEDEPLREDPMEDAGLQDEASEGPMTADDVNIDFEKFYDDAAGFPDEGIYTPPTAYEQSKSAYQVARRAEYERMREAEREARDRQRVARDREEERVMRKLESRNRKTAETVKNPPRSDEEYARGSMSRAWSRRPRSTGNCFASASRSSRRHKSRRRKSAAAAS